MTANSLRTGIFRGSIKTVLALVGIGCLVQPVLGEEAVPVEAHLLPAAEEHLSRGEAGVAVSLYREAFTRAATFEDRLSLIGPLARAAVVNREIEPLLSDLQGQEWEQAVFRAAVFQILQDLPAAVEELSSLDPVNVPPSFLEPFRLQGQVWAEEIQDVATVLPLARRGFEGEPSEENHAAYVQALLDAEAASELLSHLEERSSKLVAEADFWRSFLPKFQRSGLLDPVAVLLEEEWKKAGADAPAQFALGELRVFQGRDGEAREIFWTVVEMKESEPPVEGLAYFQRLNGFFHNRFAVKHRLGLATERYGTDSCREFSFLGLRRDVEVDDVASARDAALLFVRELEGLDGESGAFLERLLTALDRFPRLPAQRILAFAGAGAPVWMVEEVQQFVRSEEKDNVAAEFSLLALNRFLLSTSKFPELRLPMRDLARALEQNFEPGAMRDRNREMQNRILSRLGFAEVESEKASTEQIRSDFFERINEAVVENEPAEAERLYRELERREGEMIPNVLLYLANAWQAAGDPDRAAARLAEFLQPLYERRSGDDMKGTLSWPPATLPVPFYGEMELEALRGAFQVAMEAPPVWQALQEIFAAQAQSQPEESKAGAAVVATLFSWWADEREEAIAAARAGASGPGHREIKILLASALGMEKRLAEATAVLEEFASASDSAGEAARRLLFAFAVAKGDQVEVRARTDALEFPLEAGENLEVASGLVAVGLTREASDWLDRIRLDALTPTEVETCQAVQLKVYLGNDEEERAIRQARFILLQAMPGAFEELMTPGRVEALSALASAGQMDPYQDYLRDLLGTAEDSVSLHLLLGESADFLWSIEGVAEAREEALRYFREAVSLRPDLADFHLVFGEWLAKREFWDQAADEYQKALELDAPTTLLDSRQLLKVYQSAGRLGELVSFLDRWQVPEAPSLDDFYGLQPSAHIFQPLGEKLLEEGAVEEAVRAWTQGLTINPIAFTEAIRVALAEVYLEKGEPEHVLDLLKRYVDEENPDPHLYAVQPFATVVPRWIGNHTALPGESTIEKLTVLAERATGADALLAAAEEWRKEMPERISVAAFRVYLGARAREANWKEAYVNLQERVDREAGPSKGAWEAIEGLFAEMEE